MLIRILKAYWPSFRRYWFWGVLTLIGMTVSVGLQSLSPHCLRAIVETLTSPTPDPILAEKLFWRLVLIVMGIIVSFRLFDFSLSLHETYAMKDLDNRSFNVLQEQSVSFFENNYSGSLITRVRRFRSSYEQIFDLLFFQFARNLVMFIGIGVSFVSALPRLTVPFIGWASVFITYSLITSWKKYPLDRRRAETDSAVGAALGDSVTNHMAVKMFGKETDEQNRFEDVVHEAHLARSRAWLWSNIITVGQVFIVSTAELGLIYWMIQGWQRGIVTAADFVFVQAFVVWAMNQLWSFGMNLRHLVAAFADAHEMAEVFHLTPEVRDVPGAPPLHVVNGEVEFRNVRFAYKGSSHRDKDVISDFCLQIPAGQSVGIVGVSGAGKSTLIRLLQRFYNLKDGSIWIDQQDVASVTQASLRRQLAVVPQHSFMFHRTVRDNITFGLLNASEEEVIDAAIKANAWDFIQQLPKGLDTIIGERGFKLSGGQQQRIAIARALFANPRILILDEATSNLDNATERLIQESIATLLQGRTAIVIAHRLTTLMNLDRIVVMDKGRIIEDGTHDELLRMGGIYMRLWEHHNQTRCVKV